VSRKKRSAARARPARSKKRAAKTSRRSHSHDHEHHHHGHGHGHSHSHDHGDHHHEHEHEHEHEHGRGHAGELEGEPEAHREPLARGEGAGKTLFLDAFSGIAGDMTIAALVDLGVPFEVVEKAVSALPLKGVGLRLARAFAGAIGVTRFEVDIGASSRERSYAEIDDMLVRAELASDARELARRIFRRLALAECEVHRIPLEDVHFHEVGAVDAIVDIVGAAACFTYLGAEVVATPLPMGRGFVECRHGTLPLPAPATVGCLRGVPTYDAGIDAELVTPTGAAIVASVASRFERWPELAPERIGWGGGSQRLPDRPNALRVVIGQSEAADAAAEGRSHVVLEANVDDMSGELAAHAIRTLLSAGALDAWAAPITMKKGRPGLTLSALCPASAADAVTSVLLRETSSIGVRRIDASRTERPRHVVEVATEYGTIPLKVSGGPWGPPQVKPEFDACAHAAEHAGVPVRQVIAAALRAYETGA
jgi:pyridinium-3,5-bisthiocarboxylic acid mononucleotide nickel chelatase